MLAVVTMSTAPLVLLDSDLKVIVASESFYQTFDISTEPGGSQLFFDLGDGEWDTRQLRALLGATVLGDAQIGAYEFNLSRPGWETRVLILNAHKLDYDGPQGAKVLLSVTDMTDTRAAEKVKDDLLREKAMLMRELQHRVANSLQIISAVLLQSASRVSSPETRVHLVEARNRVMSVVEVQRQLALADGDDVRLKTYLEKLSASLGASMIADPARVSIEVQADDLAVPADVSVSLGLIVTELVINALKHAFAYRGGGKIVVGYEARGPNWTLSVSDDGVGMSARSVPPKAGLGTSIVEALARQLHARVQVADAQPGTRISIVHTQIAAVDDEDDIEFIGPAV